MLFTKASGSCRISHWQPLSASLRSSPPQSSRRGASGWGSGWMRPRGLPCAALVRRLAGKCVRIRQRRRLSRPRTQGDARAARHWFRFRFWFGLVWFCRKWPPCGLSWHSLSTCLRSARQLEHRADAQPPDLDSTRGWHQECSAIRGAGCMDRASRVTVLVHQLAQRLSSSPHNRSEHTSTQCLSRAQPPAAGRMKAT